MRFPHTLVLACAVLGLAPAVRAQSPASTPLKPTTGSPIAYQIGLPKGWTVERDDDLLLVSTGEAAIFVSAADLATETEDIPVSEAERRRIVTNMFMGSDSLLFALAMEMASTAAGMPLQRTTREMRSLGGERAAHLGGRCGCAETRFRVDVYVTVKDGIMYALMVMAAEDAYQSHEPLFARILDSFTLASVPAPRTAEPPRLVPSRSDSGTRTTR